MIAVMATKGKNLKTDWVRVWIHTIAYMCRLVKHKSMYVRRERARDRDRDREREIEKERERERVCVCVLNEQRHSIPSLTIH